MSAEPSKKWTDKRRFTETSVNDLLGGDLGALYLGTQGDPWDAQADIALTGAGQLGVYALHGLFALCTGRVQGPARERPGTRMDEQ